MNKTMLLGGLLTLACALPQGSSELTPIPISVRSHNQSSVDVYLLCGDRDAQWLGEVEAKETALFEVSPDRARCARGHNFFLVHRSSNRGYWVGPFQLRTGTGISLAIEKYAGLSVAQVSY